MYVWICAYVGISLVRVFQGTMPSIEGLSHLLGMVRLFCRPQLPFFVSWPTAHASSSGLFDQCWALFGESKTSKTRSHLTSIPR